MANCHNLFQEYLKELSIPKSKKNKLKNSKDSCRDAIRKHFREHHPEYEPRFYIQGSYKNGTMIKTKDDECDLDDGVYFLTEPGVTGKTLQGWVKDALQSQTSTPPQHLKKCIRLSYRGDYHIDFPVLFKTSEDKHPKLAVKDEDWGDDDPKDFVKWFDEEKDEQTVRMVKYLKGWCDYKRNKMPDGMAMTILAVNALYKIDVDIDRDDETLFNILLEVREQLEQSFGCVMPTWPFEDVFADYDQGREDRFIDALDDFIKDAEKALNEPCQEKASKLWRRHLGDKFPKGEKLMDEAKSMDKAIRNGGIQIGAAGATTIFPVKNVKGSYGSE